MVWNIENCYSKINASWRWRYWWYNACYLRRKLIIWKAQILFKVHLQKIPHHLFLCTISQTHLPLHSDLVTYLLNQHLIDEKCIGMQYFVWCETKMLLFFALKNSFGLYPILRIHLDGNLAYLKKLCKCS